MKQRRLQQRRLPRHLLMEIMETVHLLVLLPRPHLLETALEVRTAEILMEAVRTALMRTRTAAVNPQMP